MNYKHVNFIYSEPETDEEKEYEEDRRQVSDEYRGIVIQVACARIDCDVEFAFAADHDDIAKDDSGNCFIVSALPEGWGYDRYSGADASLHCPAHRNPPTQAEIEAFNAHEDQQA